MELILQSKKETHVYLAKSVPACHLMITCFLFWVSRNSRNTCSVHPSYEHFLETRVGFSGERNEKTWRGRWSFSCCKMLTQKSSVWHFSLHSLRLFHFSYLDFWVFTFFTTPKFHSVENSFEKSLTQLCERSELSLRTFWRVFENLNLGVKECYQKGQFQ